uniref:RRM domain-containing protein n=1 Tax=Stegastes partitus TaxID=144197 RepID=A0A3B5A5T4_9TELE
CASQSSSSSSSPDAPPPENHADSLTHHSPTVGTVIPNRIFVGGMGSSVNDGDLRCVFSQHGAIKEVKIVTNRYLSLILVSCVPPSTLLKANGICCKDKMLLIGQAVRKHQTSGRSNASTMCLTTSTPYTYHNGVAYFHCPNMSPPAHHWPVRANLDI